MKYGFSRFRTVIALAGASMALALPAAAKDCDAILAKGLYNKYNFADNSSFNHAIHNSICSNRSSRSDNSSSFGVNIPLPEIGSMLGFDASSDNARERVNQYCQSFSDVENRQAAINWSRSVVDSNIVQAWESCSAAKGFLCETQTLSDQQFQITLSWNRTDVGPGTEKVTLTSAPSMANASCPSGTIPQGLEILDDSTHGAICDFSNTGQDAFLIVNSSQGTTTCMAIAPVQKLTSTDHLDACLDNKETGCLGIFQDLGDATQTCEAIRALADPSSSNDLSPQTKSQLGFFAYNRCSNLNTGVSVVRNMTETMQKTCFAPNVNTNDCNQAKTQLQQSVQGYLDTLNVLTSFDVNDPEASLAN